jgi:hypothetical protein
MKERDREIKGSRDRVAEAANSTAAGVCSLDPFIPHSLDPFSL